MTYFERLQKLLYDVEQIDVTKIPEDIKMPGDIWFNKMSKGRRESSMRQYKRDVIHFVDRELEPMTDQQKEVKVLYGEDCPIKGAPLVDRFNYVGQKLVAVCMHIPVLNVFTRDDESYVDLISEIPQILSRLEPSRGPKTMISPFGCETKVDFLDYFMMPQTPELENLMSIYQMTGTLPRNAVPWIPTYAIFMSRLYNKNEHYDENYAVKSTSEQQDEPKEIVETSHRPKFNEFEMRVIGRWMQEETLEKIIHLDKEWELVTKQYAQLPHDIDDIAELEKYDYEKIMQSPIEIHDDGKLKARTRREAWFMVRFLLYMNAICEEMGNTYTSDGKKVYPGIKKYDPEDETMSLENETRKISYWEQKVLSFAAPGQSQYEDVSPIFVYKHKTLPSYEEETHTYLASQTKK